MRFRWVGFFSLCSWVEPKDSKLCTPASWIDFEFTIGGGEGFFGDDFPKGVVFATGAPYRFGWADTRFGPISEAIFDQSIFE